MELSETGEKPQNIPEVEVDEWFEPFRKYDLIPYVGKPEEKRGKKIPFELKDVSRFVIDTFWLPEPQREYVQTTGDKISRVVLMSIAQDPDAAAIAPTRFGVELKLADGRMLLNLFTSNEDLGALADAGNWFSASEGRYGTVLFNETNGELRDAKLRIVEIDKPQNQA
ncbi:MAG: hypothetical protein Q7T54_05845 [Candidatus Levybacteria bacterium]|nr:hypothetical protein [Candidatus Levybacteria bacterium]